MTLNPNMDRFAAWVFGAAALIGLAVAGALFYLDRALSDPELRAAVRQGCAARAERVFESEGWRPGGRQPDGRFATYQDYYNPRLGKCFVLIGVLTMDPRDREMRISSTLSDAFEQATYAEYFESRTTGLSPYITCRLAPPDEKPVFCHSAKEWHRLIAPYVGATGAVRQ